MTVKPPVFVAFNDTRPGHESFTVLGRVVVPDSGIVPVLTKPDVRHYGGWEVLQLTFEPQEGANLQLSDEVLVQYTEPAINSWHRLEIISEHYQQHLPILTRDA